MDGNRAYDILMGTKLIAISRGLYGEQLFAAAKALFRGGVRAIEVTFEQDKPVGQTADCIGQLADIFGEDACIGAGTVLTLEQLKAAHSAGASFIISPNTDPDIIEQTRGLGPVSIPGAMTPTEIAFAYSLGADIVKVFPAGALGIDYFKAVRAPLRHIPMAAVAGINESNIKSFQKAGAVAFGISNGLFIREAIMNGQYAEITDAARRFKSILEQ